MKELIIPITEEQCAKIACLSIFIFGISIGVYGIIVQDYVTSFIAIIMGIIISYSAASVASWDYDWDLNPMHAIGYCLRFKYPIEGKSFVNTTSKESRS